MMSLKAYGLLAFIKENPDIKLSRRAIADIFEDGEKSSGSAIKELVDLGFLTLKTVKIDSRLESYYVVHLVPKDTRTWGETGQPFLWNMLNTINNTYTKAVFTNNIRTKAFSDENEKEEEVGYKFFEKSGTSDSEIYEASIEEVKEENRKQSKKEYQAAKKARKQLKFVENDKKPVEKWNHKNTAFEFEKRTQALWNTGPITNKTEMVKAFGNRRNTVQTNGLIEYEMMNIFFASLTDLTNKTSDDLWHYFVSQWGALAQRAKLNISSPEDLQKAQEQSDEAWEKFLGV